MSKNWQQKLRFKRKLEYSFLISNHFHLLCNLIQVEPEKVLNDFMDNVGMESFALGDMQRAKAMEYFLSCGYGLDHYTEEDLRKIFKEMESIGSLFPNNGGSKLIDAHSQWRNRYFKYWYRKWFTKNRRLR